jgi:ATP-dependent Clp protease adaptor protein ClpS
MPDTLTKTRNSVDSVVLEPKKYKVLVLNDNHTPMEFVVAMLIKIFRHNEPSAIDLTMRIHNEGSAVAGIYSYEIAEQKSIEATTLARDHGHPLQIKLESE